MKPKRKSPSRNSASHGIIHPWFRRNLLESLDKDAEQVLTDNIRNEVAAHYAPLLKRAKSLKERAALIARREREIFKRRQAECGKLYAKR
jgi:hypothetical protein